MSTNAVQINDEQWNELKTQYKNTSYGEKYQFFDSVEEMGKSQKVIALNGSPLRATGNRITTSIEERLSGNNTVVIIPSGKMQGKFAIVSKTMAQKAGIMFTAQKGLSANDL